MAQTIRLGIVGCGGIVNLFHLPAIRRVREIELVAVADLRFANAAERAPYDVPLIVTDYADLYGKIDAALVSLPHALHSSACIDLLSHGIHVLVEKPMATSVEEAQAMIRIARDRRVNLAVGLMRRFYDNMLYAKRVVDTGRFGPVTYFEAEESVPFHQAQASSFYVDRRDPGAGVLFDTGAHMLDVLLWWMGPVHEVKYWDDQRGGVEANCRLELEFASGARGHVELSRMRQFKNQIQIHLRDATLTIPTLDQQTLTVYDRLTGTNLQVKPDPAMVLLDENPWVGYFARQWSDFACAILEGRPPAVPGEEGIRALELIEQCRQVRQALPTRAWEDFDEP
ncbi:MAG: Gfo/Idh/MocA family oxidoreductase [Anaerolineae bacterium]